MTTPETTLLQSAVVSAITRRIGSVADAAAVSNAAHSAYEDLVVTLAPLISQTGVEALMARAFHLTQRDHHPAEQAGEEQPGQVFGQVGLWLERQVPSAAHAAAANVFATFAMMLATLIGEPLTLRYLRKAWPDDFAGTEPKRTKT